MAGPFDNLPTVPTLQPTPTAEQGTLRHGLLGYPSAEEQSNVSQGLAIRRLTQLLQQPGASPQQAVLQLFSTDEGQQALVDDHRGTLLQAIQDTIKSVTTNPNLKEVGAGNSLADFTNPAAPKTVYTAPTQPTEAEKVSNAIIDADKNGDTKRVELLKRYLPKDAAAQTTMEAAVKLRAAGVDKTGNDVADAISPEQARTSIEIARSPSESDISMTDVLVRATGAKTGNPKADALTPDAAEATAKFYKETHGAEDLLGVIFGGIGKTPGAPGGGGETPSAAAKFRAKQQGGEVAPTAPPQVPLAGGSAAPGSGPQVYTPEQLQALTGPELDRVYLGARSGTIQLSPAQIAILAGRYKTLGQKVPTAPGP